jgi:hypothetical protein
VQEGACYRLLIAAGQHIAAIARPYLRLTDVYGLNKHSVSSSSTIVRKNTAA